MDHPQKDPIFIPFRQVERLVFLPILLLLGSGTAFGQDPSPRIIWPDSARVAVSLTFDDARLSQVDVGLPLFQRFDAKVTFYVVPNGVEERLDGWRALAAAGHEIGNHTLVHPCTGNFPWARERALEDYTLEKMRAELTQANARIEELLSVQPVSFAYPCGQTFVGRGLETRSYVPLVAELFESGRGWLDEGPNDPAYVDFAQLTGMEMDGKDFDEILALIEGARSTGAWLVLAGHEIGQGGLQTTHVDMLEALLEYASNPEHGIWIAPVHTVAQYIADHRP